MLTKDVHGIDVSVIDETKHFFSDPETRRRIIAISTPSIQRIPSYSYIQSVDRSANEHDLFISELIGIGSYGKVYKGQFEGKDVAIKELLNITQTSEADLQHEANISEYIHLNTFLSEKEKKRFSVSKKIQSGDKSFLVSDLCRGGNLDTFSRSADPLLAVEIIKQLKKIGKALNKSMLLHRDIACRNVFVHVNELNAIELKIGDFGLSMIGREYKDPPTFKRPIRWCHPEDLITRTTNHSTDTYMLAVTMMESLSLIAGKSLLEVQGGLGVSDWCKQIASRYVEGDAARKQLIDMYKNLSHLIYQSLVKDAMQPAKNELAYYLGGLHELGFSHEMMSEINQEIEIEFVIKASQIPIDESLELERTPELVAESSIVINQSVLTSSIVTDDDSSFEFSDNSLLFATVASEYSEDDSSHDETAISTKALDIPIDPYLESPIPYDVTVFIQHEVDTDETDLSHDANHSPTNNDESSQTNTSVLRRQRSQSLNRYRYTLFDRANHAENPSSSKIRHAETSHQHESPDRHKPGRGK